MSPFHRLSQLHSHLRMSSESQLLSNNQQLHSNDTATRAPVLGKAADASQLRQEDQLSSHVTPQPDRGDDAKGRPQSNEAAMYSSRQIATFQPTKSVKQEKTDIVVNEFSYYPVPKLQDYVPDLKQYPNLFVRTKIAGHASPTYNQLIQDREFVMLDIVRRQGLKTKSAGFIRAGPRKEIIWGKREVVAAIVTCGGLCPGMNDVISELFTTLHYNYGVDTVYGVRNGLRGFWDDACKPWIQLTPERIHGIYELGGTVLGSARGGFDLEKIMRNLVTKDVNQVYIIGGDGTHRAADAIATEAKRRGLKMAVVGIPKTIDNDLGVIDRSFGFGTAVTEARKAIQAAVVEASCAPNGVGIVQLMGRHAGYIAAHATLATRQVDVCLIPEIQFPLTGPNGLFELTEYILKRQGYCVIVVAEGAGSDLVADSATYDEGGNKKLPEIGKFLSANMTAWFKERKVSASLKLIDPSYMIRAVSADASDAIMCQSIAQNAVHGAMAGYTGFSSGLVNNRSVLIPFDLIAATSPSYLNPDGRTWERVLSLTHQPMFRPMPTDIQKSATAHNAEAAGNKKSPM